MFLLEHSYCPFVFMMMLPTLILEQVLLLDADRRHIKLANHKEEEKSKTRRTILRGQRKQKSDKRKENEGDTYLPGGS